mmetsp:Transcript_104714/g.168529  ORF Transcript_104714/g.168529 Transcript_104714/m.168529 type:complete len:124 (+) Transcript_104714:34-405(+)
MLSFGQMGAPGMVACSAAAAAGAAAAAAATGPLWAQNGARAANGKGRTPEPENGVTRGAPRASAEPEQGGNIRMFPRRKNGDTLFPTKGRPPITVDLDCLRPLFNLPQPEAARKVNYLSHAHK